ncbi:eukaryotic translation initiation factor 3 subunit F [Diutina catenulata]
MFMHLVRPNVAAPAASSALGPAKIKIHTPALLQILEIVAKQVLPEQKRAIGTLLGIRSDDGSEFEIREAFMVPCSETGDSVSLDDGAHKTMYQLYKKAHPKEAVLGWFGSSEKIDDTTGLIHDFYSKGADRAYPHPAIYLNVDFMDAAGSPKTPEITTYIGAAIGKAPQGWKQANYIFSPIPNEVVHATATEQIAYQQLALGKTLSEDLDFLDQQLDATSNQIDSMLTILPELESKNDDSSLEVLRYLSNTLLTKPKMATDPSVLQSEFRSHNQDVVMIEYLTRAVKEQIELSAKLTQASELEKKA